VDGLLHTIQINHKIQGCVAGLGGSVLNFWTVYMKLPTAELQINLQHQIHNNFT